MNTRIKSLSEQIGVNNPFVQETMEHFAELLLRDCVNICLNSQIAIDADEWMNSSKRDISRLTAEGLAKKIKEHYGV